MRTCGKWRRRRPCQKSATGCSVCGCAGTRDVKTSFRRFLRTWRRMSPRSISVLRRACHTRALRPDITTTDQSGTLGTCAGSPGPVAAIAIDWACIGRRRAIVAVTPDRRRFRFGATTSIVSSVNDVPRSRCESGTEPRTAACNGGIISVDPPSALGSRCGGTRRTQS